MQPKFFLLILSLFSCFTCAQRSLNIGVSSGFNQSYASPGSIDTEFAKAISNPFFSAPLRHISISAQLGITKSVALSMDLGYSKMLGGISVVKPNRVFPFFSEYPELSESVFLEPGVAHTFPLDELFHIVTSLSSAVHFNISGGDNERLRGSYFSGDLVTDIQVKDRMPVFVTINPGIEFRSLPTQSLRIGFVVKYLQGLGTVAQYGGSVSHNEVSEQYNASYSGSGVLLALRLSYCLPCRN